MTTIKDLENEYKNRHISRRSFMEGAVYLGLTSAAALSLSSGIAMAATPKQGGRFRIGLASGSTTDSLNPATLAGTFARNMTRAYANTLTEVSATGALIPELAEKWESDADAKTWVFHIRKGVEFHNGKTLSADDVIASINHHRDETSGSAVKAIVKDIVTVKRNDDHTVTVVLSDGNANFPFIMSDFHLSIFPEKDGAIDWTSGIGTGAYKLKDFEPGTRAFLSKNENYWKTGHGHFKEIELIVILDVTARNTAVINDSVDAIEGVDIKTANLLARVPQLRLLETTGLKHYTMPMHTNVAPYNNNHVRMAIKLSCDRQEILDKILKGHGSLGNDQPIGPASTFYDPKIEQRVRDLDKAKWHLKQAGLTSLDVTLSATDTPFSGAIDTALLLQAQLAPTGINVKVERVAADGYWSNTWNKKPWCTAFWGGRPTEDWMFSLAYGADSSWNDTKWQNARFNELLVTARKELNDEKRAAMYSEMQMLVRDDGGALIPAFANNLHALRNNVQHAETVAGNWELDGGRAVERWWFS